MANRKISDLTALTAPATGDLLPIVDISEAVAADKNKKITYGELLSSAPAGSAAAPSFSFDGDPNSGLYSAGADQVAVSTGGTGRLFIDASGRVGIGTSSPTHELEVAGRVALVGTQAAFQNSSIPTIYRSGSSAGSYPFNNFGHLIIQPRCDGSNRDIVFATGTSGANKVVIDSSGRVGIGTTSPARILDVAGSADFAVPNGQGIRLGYRGETKTAYIGIDANDTYSVNQSWANSCWIGFESGASDKNILYRANANHIFMAPMPPNACASRPQGS